MLGVGPWLGGCGGDANEIPVELLDPQQCGSCHPDHYTEWLSSMHAYAADDPVFVAMNARGQRETNGALGDFCIKCHAPVAVQLGETTDGLNLDELPAHLKGVTCYFCHQVDAVEGTHDNPLRLAFDRVMRGGFPGAEKTEAHGSDYSRLHDQRAQDTSSALCGSCHDIVNPNGVHIERTYAEWLASLFADEEDGQPTAAAQGCGQCHMRTYPGAQPITDLEGAPDRARHRHLFAGVDVALTPFPNAEQAPQLEALQRARIAEIRETILCSSMCVQDLGGQAEVTVWLHNEAAGHGWPSGANADRRAWLELRAYDPDEFHRSGVVADDESIDALDDPELWLFRDRLLNEAGEEVHMFWEAASYESQQLQVPAELSLADDDSVWVKRVYALERLPERVTTRVRLRAMAFEVIDDLIGSGDLDPQLRARFETFEIPPTQLEWTAADALAVPGYGSCVSTVATCQAPEVRDALENP
jgi:hypothetical protein